MAAGLPSQVGLTEAPACHRGTRLANSAAYCRCDCVRVTGSVGLSCQRLRRSGLYTGPGYAAAAAPSLTPATRAPSQAAVENLKHSASGPGLGQYRRRPARDVERSATRPGPTHGPGRKQSRRAAKRTRDPSSAARAEPPPPLPASARRRDSDPGYTTRRPGGVRARPAGPPGGRRPGHSRRGLQTGGGGGPPGPGWAASGRVASGRAAPAPGRDWFSTSRAGPANWPIPSWPPMK